MPDAVNLSYAIGLPPTEAIKYFKDKGYAISWNWHDTWQEAHATAFTVAKAMRMDVLQDIRDELDKALQDGTTLATFQANLQSTLEAKGWWGKTEEGVQLGSPYRLETIFRTNLQTAYSAGRFSQQMENSDNEPYWQYIAVMDSRTRPAHAEMNGLVFKYDDPFWDTFYPPNGFNCRCRVRTLSSDQVDRRKLDVSSGRGRMTWEDQKINSSGDEMPVSGYDDPRTGKTIYTDPGWSYNPGKTSWTINKAVYDPKLVKIAKP